MNRTYGAESGPIGTCSSLELLLLVLAKRGLATPYELLTHAGLSVGTTGRALKRLEKAKLLSGTERPRRSRRFELTPKGKAAIAECWQSIIDDTAPVSLETALRTIFLAWLFGERDVCFEYAKRATEELQDRASGEEKRAFELRQELCHMLPVGGGTRKQLPVKAIARVYRWMKSATDVVVLRAEAQALQALLFDLKELHPGDG